MSFSKCHAETETLLGNMPVVKRGSAGYQKAEWRRGGGRGQRSTPAAVNCAVPEDFHPRHHHKVQPPELSDLGQTELHSASEISSVCCSLFGHWLPQRGAAPQCYGFMCIHLFCS